MAITDELTKKVENAILNNRLVGDMVFTEDEYEALLEYTRGFSSDYNWGKTWNLGGIKDIHFVTLVEIAKRWKRIDDDENDEGGFWDFVFKTIGADGYTWTDQKLYSAYTGLISGLGRANRILIANTAKKYWATLMMHAFAPIKSIYAFLDLCYNIYRKDLDFNYTESDKWVCEIATIRFCEILQSAAGNEKTISIGSNTYGVKIGLRTLALNDATQNEFVILIDRTLEIIDKLFRRTAFASKSYFEGIINDWWQNKLAEVRIDRKTGNRSSAAVTKQNITAKFIRNDDTVNLVIPPIRLDSKGSTVWLSIYAGENGEQRYSNALFTRYGELTVTTTQKEFDLNELLKDDESIKIRVEITENGVVLYDKTIEREFILFDGENEVLSQLNKTSNYFVYARNIDSLRTPADIQTHGSNLYNIYPKVGETLAGVARQVFFVDKATATSNKSTVSLFGSLSDCEWRFDDIGCSVFGGKVRLIVPNDTALNGLVLSVDAKRSLLSDLTYRQEDGYKLFDISDFVPKCEPTEVVVYSHQKEVQLIGVYIVVFPNLNIVLSKSAYYGKDEKKLTIFVDDDSRDLYWANSDNEVVYPFNEGQLVVKIPYIRWRIDDKNWNKEPLNRRQWYKSHFHSCSFLEIDSPHDLENSTVFALIEGQVTAIERNKISGKFEVGRYIYATENKQEIMFFLQNAGKTHELFIVSTAEHFKSPPLAIVDAKVVFRGGENFIGERERKFVITFKSVGREEQVFDSDKLESGIIAIDEGIYWATVRSKISGIFAKADKVFWQGEFVFGDEHTLKLSNIVLKISPIVGIGIISDFWREVNYGYRISNLIRTNNEDVYTAQIYYLDSIGNTTAVGGTKNCLIEIISQSALTVLVADDKGKYAHKLTFNANSKKIEAPNSPNLFKITNFNYLEIKNV